MDSPLADSTPASQDAAPASAIVIDHLSHTYPPSRRSRRAKSQADNGDESARDDAGRASARPALHDVSLEVQPGEIFGVLGPNGSGKSTLFRILATLLRPSAGRASILGHDVVADASAVRRDLGVVFQMPSLDVKLTARENLLHQGHLYGLSGAALRQRIDEQLGFFHLADRQNEAVERFSGGMRRRVELAKALLHHPRLLLLDEPATGLDPGARSDLWQQLQSLRQSQGVTVALTTHLMEEADRCDRLAVLNAGVVVAVDTPAALKSQIGGHVITLTPKVDASAQALADAVTTRFAPWPGTSAPSLVNGKVHLEKPDGPAFLAQVMQAFPDRIASVTVGQPTLEDVYLHLTGHTLWE